MTRHSAVYAPPGTDSAARRPVPADVPTVVRRPRRWARRILALALLAALGYLGVTFVQVVVASRTDDTTPTGAAVVLGAAQYDGVPSPVLRARLDRAHELYDAGVVPEVVLTGSKQPGDRYTEAYAGYRYLAQQGVPLADLVIVDDGTSTHESLEAAQRVLRGRGIDSVTLVSDGSHARRLEGIAEELGLDARVSTSGVTPSWRTLGRETALVATGELVGYGRLLRHTPQ